MNEITKTKEGWQASCDLCNWKRGHTSVKPVAEAWSEIHDCKKDAKTTYSFLGCRTS